MVKTVLFEKEIEIPKEVTFSIDNDKKITVKGKNGIITKEFGHAKFVDIKVVKNIIYLKASFPRKRETAIVTTLANLISNMFLGVQKGYTYKMKIVYSHFPITVVPPKKGEKEILIKNFIGERAPRKTYSVGDVAITANKEEVIVSGPDKELVGQTCANIQLKCKIKEKDKRIFQDGVYVFEKLVGDDIFWQIK